MDRRLPLLYIGLAALAATLSLFGFSYSSPAEATPVPIRDQGTATAQASPNRLAPRAAAAAAAPNRLAPRAAQADRAPEADALPVETVLRAGWGSGPGELGHKLPQEGNPEGPMSFVVDADGRIAILDQVNQRVQFFAEGQDPTSLDLPADTYQDLTLDPDGKPVVLDRLARRSIETYGADGKLLSQVPLEGDGIAEGGAVTGLFSRKDGTWVEVEHSRVVQVADSQGRPLDERTMLPGRFSADGRSLLTAIRESADSAIVLIQPRAALQAAPELLARVRFSLPIAHLLALESDPAGRVMLAALVIFQRPEAPHDVLQAFEEVLVLGPDGRLLHRVAFPANQGPEEQFRPVRLGADGSLYQLYMDEHGVRMNKVVIP